MQDVNNRGTGVESSILSAQILSKPKTALKNQLKKKKRVVNTYKAGTRYQALLSVFITLTHSICTTAL